MAEYRELRSTDLRALVDETGRRLDGPGRLFLIGRTSHLVAGWRSAVERFDLAGGYPGADALRNAVRSAAATLGVPVSWEHPGDVIPLPDGYDARIRPTDLGDARPARLEACHFDPYSVVFRAIARGDEPDYHTALGYLVGGWVIMDEMEAMLERTLSRFTRETIQQDPAEFRRKFRGLRQMWRARGAGPVRSEN